MILINVGEKKTWSLKYEVIVSHKLFVKKKSTHFFNLSSLMGTVTVMKNYRA